jgi:hypothetical protein
MNVVLGSLLRVETWDRLGMVASTVCAVHCVVTPIAAMLLPAVAAAEGVTHWTLAAAVVLFAVLAFVPGASVHGERRVLLLGLMGVAMIWTALLTADLLADAQRDGLTVAGGLVMVLAHLFNTALCRRCALCCGECEAADRTGSN